MTLPKLTAFKDMCAAARSGVAAQPALGFTIYGNHPMGESYKVMPPRYQSVYNPQ